MMRFPLCLAASVLLCGGCTLSSPYIPVTADQNDLITFGSTPAYRCASLVGRLTHLGAGLANCPPPKADASGCNTANNDHAVPPAPRYVRCRYHWARSYLQDRFTSASIRAEELRRIQLFGRLGVFVGLAGAAGNALFEGAKAATLSWAYGAGVGFAAHEGFVPERLAFAYQSGAFAFACVLGKADAAWAAAPTDLPSPSEIDEGESDLHSRSARLGTAIARAEKRPTPLPTSPGSQLDVAMRLHAELVELGRFSNGIAHERADRVRDYEVALASAVVSITDALAVTINIHVDAETPTIVQVQQLGMALTSNVRSIAAAAGKTASGSTQPASSSTENAKLDNVVKTPTKTTDAARLYREDPDLQEAINLAVASARSLRTKLQARDIPDFSTCVPPLPGGGPVLVVAN